MEVGRGPSEAFKPNSQTSFQVITPVVDVVLFFNDDSVSIRLTSPRGNNPESDFVEKTVKAFGSQLVDKLCEPGVATELSKPARSKACVFNKKNGGTNPKLKEALLKVLKALRGTPSFMTNLFKSGMVKPR